MKRLLLLLALLVCHFFSFTQVGIGTTSPNSFSVLDLSSTSKGLLIPRMTESNRNEMFLSSAEEGMLIYQTTPVKGFYAFDGISWQGIQKAITSNVTGSTMYWDNQNKVWQSTTNLFNQGTSIGIGTQSPKVQLHINSSNASTTRLQFTNNNTGSNTGDGFILGINLSNQHAQLMQQESKPLTFGTSGVERVRIDSIGNTGIRTTNPTAALDVNGTAKIGTTGSVLNSIIRLAHPIMLSIPGNSEWIASIAVPNAELGSSVHVSPGQALSSLLIEYARVSSFGYVEIKFMNMSSNQNAPGEVMFYLTVIN